MSIEKAFSTSDEFESQGVWIDYGDEQVRITRAGAKNKKYKQVFRQLSKPHERGLRNETLEDDIAEELMKRTYAKSIVVGWRHKDQKDGKKWVDGKMLVGGKSVDANEDNVFNHFMKYHEFFLDLKAQSEKLSLFQEEEIEEEVGK